MRYALKLIVTLHYDSHSMKEIWLGWNQTATSILKRDWLMQNALLKIWNFNNHFHWLGSNNEKTPCILSVYGQHHSRTWDCTKLVIMGEELNYVNLCCHLIVSVTFVSSSKWCNEIARCRRDHERTLGILSVSIHDRLLMFSTHFSETRLSFFFGFSLPSFSSRCVCSFPFELAVITPCSWSPFLNGGCRPSLYRWRRADRLIREVTVNVSDRIDGDILPHWNQVRVGRH